MTAFDPTKFTAPKKNSIVVTSGIRVSDEVDLAWRFTRRFGEMWRLIPNQYKTYYLFDKEDKIQFTLQALSDRWEIAAYPNVTQAEFKDSWQNDPNRSLLCANAIYYDRKGGEYQDLWQLVWICKQHGIEI